MLQIHAVGGYSEVGRNMTAVCYKDEAVIFDMGIHLENYIRLKGDDDYELFSTRDLIKAGAIPDDTVIKDLRKKVIAIVPSHAHLDHIGAIPFMAAKYDAPIICTHYTASVINAILKDKKSSLPNEIRVLKTGRNMRLSDSLTLEFVNMTHSVPDTAMVVLHTPDGQVAYMNDFKLDNTPGFGKKPDYDRMIELGNGGKVAVLIMDSLYSNLPRKTPSESIAREMLKEVLLDVNSDGKAVIVSTFSSHIARLKSIIEFGTQMKRKIVLMGRSLGKYVYAAEDVGLVDFSSHVEICSYKSQIRKMLKHIDNEGRSKYLIVATGHQGEPDSTLSRMVNGDMGFKLMPEDHVIFSCAVIPSPMNIANREMLENKLKEQRVRLFKDIHQSGHASREDHREVIKMLKPMHIIPGHCPPERAVLLSELANEFGYKLGKTTHVLANGQVLEI